ncbi:O-acetyltransferase OatA [compost metagenome]
MGQATARGFRADINGLRAWAVVAVVLYHFEVAGLQGGFVGVDVFFVISGFLMTGIVLSALQSGHFSLW